MLCLITTVLNVCSHFDSQELDFLEQRPVFEMIAAIPENNDVAAAPAKVENREVPGAQGSYLRWFRCA